MAQENSYQVIAESLLGRPLTKQDGIDPLILERVEQSQAILFPLELKEFYQTVGLLPQFMGGFQLFALPEQLHMKEGALIFLEESQGSSCWGVDNEGNVIQFDEDNIGYGLDFTLKAFLELMLYYQVAQGAEYSFCSNLLDQELEVLYHEQGWQQVVNYDDLVIYQLGANLIWYFKDDENSVLDDQVYFVSLLEVPDTVINQYVLEAL